MRILLAVFVSLAFGCGPGGECAVDTDCPFAEGLVCNAEHMCVPRGSGMTDAGPRDTGAPMDTGPRDVGGEVGATDAPVDGPTADAPSGDGGSCPDIAGNYRVTMLSAGCIGVTVSRLTISAPDAECDYAVQADSRDVGTLMARGGMLTARVTLTVPLDCTVRVNAMAGLDVTCGACMVTTLPTP